MTGEEQQVEAYDLIIVGAGPSGIFTAYEMKKNQPSARILMIEKGRSIEKRKCPKRTTGICAECDPCNITAGFSGGGSFSDGKLSINEHGEVGGELIHYIGAAKYKQVLAYTDSLYLEFGADPKVYGDEDGPEMDEIRRKVFQADLRLIDSKVRHIGTDKASHLYLLIEHKLQEMGIEMMFNTTVTDLITEPDRSGLIARGVVLEDGKELKAVKVILGVGREGSGWLDQMRRKYAIASRTGQVDIGLRIETDSTITAHIDNLLYEAKLVYYTKTFDDKVRTFCWNPRGEVVEEKYEGNLAAVNGHSYKDEAMKTGNTNFALLVSKHFTEPFHTPNEYGRYIATLGNMLSGNKVLVQRYGDLKRGRRTNTARLAKNNIQPTLHDAVPGDLSLVLPHRLMLDITETLEALDHIMPGLAGDGTLLYGVEVKFYANQIVVDDNFQTCIRDLHALGDGAGLTRGLMQASMNGVCMGRMLSGSWE